MNARPKTLLFSQSRLESVLALSDERLTSNKKPTDSFQSIKCQSRMLYLNSLRIIISNCHLNRELSREKQSKKSHGFAFNQAKP
jgi:hypothetical protein